MARYEWPWINWHHVFLLGLSVEPEVIREAMRASPNFIPGTGSDDEQKEKEEDKEEEDEEYDSTDFTSSDEDNDVEVENAGASGRKKGRGRGQKGRRTPGEDAAPSDEGLDPETVEDELADDPDETEEQRSVHS